MNKISVVIITFNEEKNIKRCLDSVKDIADEIIVVDSFSKDQTASICREYDEVIFLENPFEGHIQQKNYAMQQASNEFVLSLDADEALDEQLKASIKAIKPHLEADGYTMNRLTNYCGQWIRHCGWYPDRKLRLWNKSKGQWGGENPHDRLIMQPEARVAHLKGDILHYSYDSVNDHLRQIQFFTDISAREAVAKGKTTNLLMLLLKPLLKFIGDYFIRLGFLDGFYGLMISLHSAYAKFVKYLKIYELGRGKKLN